MNKIYLLFIIFFTEVPLTIAQREANWWVFGHHCAINFDSNKVNVKNSMGIAQMRFGSMVMGDKSGNLLFSSYGPGVWDSRIKQMPHSNWVIADHYFSTQPIMSIPWPGKPDFYFIITLGSPSRDSLKFCVLNMGLNKGFGDIDTTFGNISLPTLSLGKMNAVKHANRKDIWLIVPHYGTDSIHAYLITSNGFVTTRVKSKLGFKLTYTYPTDIFGFLKCSPDGKKICYLNYRDSSVFADFDASTGKISNSIVFKPMDSYGVEFSPKSQYLYMFDYLNGFRLLQFNARVTSKKDFLKSQKTIDSGSVKLDGTALQVALDGKIYISEYLNGYLHSITFPDSLGKKAKFVKNDIYLEGRTCAHGLPDFVQSYFHKPHFFVKPNCTRDTVFFEIADKFYLDSAKWDFGEYGSKTNISNKTTNVYHSYSKPGIYKIKLISYNAGFIDTIYETLNLNYGKPYLGRDTFFCNTDNIGLSPKGYYQSYKWSNGSKGHQTFLSQGGTISLTVTDFDGCKNSDTIVIKNIIVKPNFSINTTRSCIKNNLFTLKETTQYTSDKPFKSTWYFDDNTIVKDTVTQKSYTQIGNHSIKLISQSELGCRDSTTKTINVYPNPKANFSINDSSQCFNGNSFDFKITKDTGIVNYTWDLGDQSITVGTDIIGKKYVNSGKYKIQLIANSDKNCSDTLTQFISILGNPLAQFSYDLTCSRTATQFQYLGSKPIQTITWNFANENTSNDENPRYLFNSTGNKKVTLVCTSSNGCKDSITQQLLIKKQSMADFTANDVCQGDSAIFINKSQDATSFNWKFGDGTNSNLEAPKHKYQITNSTTFNVTLVAIVNDGCSDSITKPISIYELPNSDFSFTRNGQMIEAKAKKNGLQAYIWKFGSFDSVITFTNQLKYTLKTGETKICLRAVDNTGCHTETCKDAAAGISKLIKPNAVKIYPNPANQTITINANELTTQEINIQLINSLGQVVMQKTAIKHLTFNIQHLPVGVYFVRVNSGEMIWSERVIITHE